VAELDRFLPGIIGAAVGVVGWLLVGVYMQRRQFARQAMNAGRAVYFELLINRMNVVVRARSGQLPAAEPIELRPPPAGARDVAARRAAADRRWRVHGPRGLRIRGLAA